MALLTLAYGPIRGGVSLEIGLTALHDVRPQRNCVAVLVLLLSQLTPVACRVPSEQIRTACEFVRFALLCELKQGGVLHPPVFGLFVGFTLLL